MRAIVASLLLASLAIVPELNAQSLRSSPHRGVTHVPVGHEVYALLRQLSVKQLIEDYSEVQLPLSEFEVGEYLRSVDTTKLSNVERAQRLKYLEVVAHESYPAVTLFGADSSERLLSSALFSDKQKYLYRWRDEATHSEFYANGIASAELRRRMEPDPGSVVLGVIGGRMSGTLSGHVGMFLQATNGQTFGDSTVALEDPMLSKNKNYTAYSKNNFDETTAELAYNYDWFTGKLARIPVAIGGSYQGDNVILSPQVPVYDFVSLQGRVGAVRYQAVVASLLGEADLSLRPDSTDLHQYGAGAIIDSKFLTAHNLTFFLGRDVEIGFTDMVIFSRRFDLAYLNPFSFLKSVEHALNDRDNGLLGAHARVRLTPNVEMRGQVLMDDVVAGKIGEGWWGNKFAWQTGLMWTSPFSLSDMTVQLEWTRVEPFMYSHFHPQNTFSTSSTILGSQIGPNAMSYWGRLHWNLSADLFVDLDLQYLQRGENEYDSTGTLVFNAGSDFRQSIRSEEEKSRVTRILDGRRVDVVSVTGYVQYEPWRGFQFFARGTNKVVDYLNGVPMRPLERSEVTLAIGGRALF